MVAMAIIRFAFINFSSNTVLTSVFMTEWFSWISYFVGAPEIEWNKCVPKCYTISISAE